MSRLARLVVAWAINVAAIWLAHDLFSGVHIHGRGAYLIGAGVLGIANAVLKPVLTILTLPLVLVTLGLFLLVINAAMLGLVAWLLPGLHVDGFRAALLGSLIVSITGWIGSWLIGSRARVEFYAHRKR